MALRRRNYRTLENNIKPQNNNNSNDLEISVENVDDFVLDFSPEIPEGQCKFSIAHVDMEKNVQTDQGIKDKIVIKFKLRFNNDGNTKAYDLEKRFNKSRSYNSMIYKMCELMLGNIQGKRVNLKKLEGILGTCEIKYKKLPNGNVFASMTKVKVDNEASDEIDYLENEEDEEDEENFDE